MDLTVHCSLILSLFCIFFSSSAAHDAGEQLPPALVIGTVYCDTCFHQEFSKSSHFISGASVAVECGDAANKPSFRKVATTNRRGVFRVRLPAKISKHVHLIEACSVKLIESNEPFCAVASSATTAAGLRLKSRRHGVHVYSAGFFSFKPLSQPELCYQKPVLRDQKQDQFGVFVPLPTITFPPSPASTGGFPLPTNPFLPPPNPLQSPPFPIQPPSSMFNTPPIPLLAPPPPALPSPPFPFLPFPLFPGVPPAFSSKKTSP